MARSVNREQSSATRADVARLAEVSVATVSYVLNNSVRLPEATRRRVFEAAEKLNYRPNHVARSLATRRTMQLAIVLNNISNPIYADLIRGFEREAIAQGYFVTICTGSHNVDDYFDNFAARGMDGLFVEVLPGRYHRERLRAVLHAGIPVVVFGDAGIGGNLVSVIENDYAAAMRQAVGHLVALGHSRICYVSGLAVSHRQDGRIRHFRAAVHAELGEADAMVVAPSASTPTNVSDGENLTAVALERHPDTTAIICTNDLMAMGAIRAARTAGRRVPEDLSIVGIDNAWVSEFSSPPLTTLAADYTSTGAEAFALLHADIVRGERLHRVRPLELLVRESTAPLR